MSQQQLIRSLRRHIADRRVLDAMAGVPRDVFVPESQRAYAWENAPLPIGSDQTISQPVVVAHMCELLALRGDERVLDVGTGSGYHAAVLARLAAHVWSIEVRPELSARAAENLAAAGVANVTLVVGDGTLGHPAAAPYDAINVAAATAEIPPALLDQLAPEGRLVAPVGPPGAQRLTLVCRHAHHDDVTTHSEVRFVPLVAARASSGR